MKVFRISADDSMCQAVVTDDSFSGKMEFDGTSKIATWDPSEFHVVNPIAHKTEFFVVGVGAFAMTEFMRWHPVLAMFFEMAGELLPISLESGEKLFILNVTAVGNALDKRKSILRTDVTTKQIIGVEKHAFIPTRFPQSTIFKVPESRFSTILATCGDMPEPDDEFLPTLLRLNIPGLKLRELWSSEED